MTGHYLKTGTYSNTVFAVNYFLTSLLVQLYSIQNLASTFITLNCLYIIVFVDCRIDEDCYDDGFHLSPLAIYSWLTRVMYNRRSKFDPLWNTVVVGGLEKGEPCV